MDIPTTMRALVANQPGPPEVLTIAQAPVPLLINSEVLVKVAAAGINPIDAKTRAGRGAAESRAARMTHGRTDGRCGRKFNAANSWCGVLRAGG